MRKETEFIIEYFKVTFIFENYTCINKYDIYNIIYDITYAIDFMYYFMYCIHSVLYFVYMYMYAQVSIQANNKIFISCW